jgi:protease YdgD
MSKNRDFDVRLRCMARPVAVALLVTAAAVTAALSEQPGLIDKDDRQPVTTQGRPWDAIGQVNVGGYRSVGQCTGTLVRPDLVITAAHCVMDDAKASPHPLHNIHFLSGVSGDRNLGHAQAKCLRFLKGYTYVPLRNARGVPLSALYQDVAAIVLTVPLDIEPAAVASPRTREPSRTRGLSF